MGEQQIASTPLVASSPPDMVAVKPRLVCIQSGTMTPAEKNVPMAMAAATKVIVKFLFFRISRSTIGCFSVTSQKMKAIRKTIAAALITQINGEANQS